MEQQEKLEYIKSLREDTLRKNIVIPLLDKMSAKGIKELHGPDEPGLDVVFYEEDIYERKFYTGVVIKRGDISGEVGKTNNASQVLYQARQAIKSQFIEPENLSKKGINKCLIICSGNITQKAQRIISDDLQELKREIIFFSGEKLVSLLDKYLPELFYSELRSFQRYFDSLRTEFEQLKEISNFGVSRDVFLEEIYIDLELSREGKKKPLKEEHLTKEMLEKLPKEEFLEVGKVTPQEAIKRFKKMVILGTPGAGKTTLLRHLVLSFCKENIKAGEKLSLPILITASRMIESGKESIVEYIKEMLKKYAFEEAIETLEQDLKDKKVQLLLDGFDEVTGLVDQKRLLEMISAFCDDYPDNLIIVTSRIAGYKDELSKFTKLEIKHFTDEQIKKFLNNWFRKSEDKFKAGDLYKIIGKQKGLKEIACNPLLLTILTIVYEMHGELPERRVRLYEKCISALLEEWDRYSKRKRFFAFNEEAKRFVLQKVALEFHRRGVKQLSGNETEQLVSKYLAQTKYMGEEAVDFLDEVERGSFILHQSAEGIYQFIHLTFQEYLVAYELHETKDYNTIRANFYNSWWEEVIVLFCGIEHKIDRLVKELKPTKKEDLLLTAKCLADADWTDKKLKQDVAKRLLEILRTTNKWDDEYEEIRIRIAGIGKDIIPWLGERLKESSDFSLSKDICNILGKIKHEEAIPYLKERLNKEKEPNANVRYAAYEALELIGTQEAKEICSKVFVIAPEKLKGNEPFEIEVRGKKIKINDDGSHPGMVRIAGEFWLDVYPVTNAEFEQVFPGHERSPFSPYDDSPVTKVTWPEANAYAKKMGKRLPTEQEWEKAAKGPEGWEYSFGAQFDINKCRAELVWADGAAKVNSVYDENVNGYGVYDMSGNVWEWTDSWYDEEKGWRVLRGGSWLFNRGNARCTYRYYGVIPVSYCDLVGFRCARTL